MTACCQLVTSNLAGGEAAGQHVVLACLLLSVWCGSASGGETPARDRASVRRLLTFYGNDADRVLSGQNAGHADHRPRVHYDRFVTALGQTVGEVPAIVSIDYGYEGTPASVHEANACLIEHWQAGGLVMISMHPPNPWTRTGAHDLAVGDFEDLFRTQTAVHAVWMAELQRVARGLRELRDAGVVVLWRPFHEMNGGWFWWGYRRQGKWLPVEQFQHLWQETHRFLVQEQKLHNLLWVYSPSVRYETNQKSPRHYYPGDDWVDVAALDWYTDDPQWPAIQDSYRALADLKKPIGLAEFGNHSTPVDQRWFLRFLRQSPHPWAFFSYWHSWEGRPVAIIDQPQAARLLQHPTVVNRGDLIVPPPPDLSIRDALPLDQPVIDRPVIDRPVIDRPVIDRPVIDRPTDRSIPAGNDPVPNLPARPLRQVRQ